MSPLLVLSCAALTLSCPPPSAVEHGGQEHFHFLPPLVPQPEFAGTFDPSRDPVVEICALEASGCEPVITEFTMERGPGSEAVRVDTTAEHYIVNWHTDEFDLDDGQVYRIRVLLEGLEVGQADVHVVASGQDLKNAETEAEIPLKDGRILPIKFRIEKGLDRGDDIPRLPPDSVPEAVLNEIYDPANVIDGSPFITGKIPGNIIWIAFQYDAPQSKKQEAIDFIDGEVVGGIFMDPGGLYFVRISTDGTVEQLFEAIEQLEAFDQVRFATPDLNLEWSPNHRGPAEAHGGMGDRVPAVPPDSLPSSALADSIHSPENQVADPRLGSRVPSNIVFVAFHAEATQQERQEAIDLIDGRVIGGLLDWYIVKIATDGTAESLVHAIEALKGLPQVRLAGPHPPGVVPAVATP